MKHNALHVKKESNPDQNLIWVIIYDLISALNENENSRVCLYFGSAIMLMTYFVNFRKLNDHLFGKELFILFAASAFRKLSSIYVFSYFPFGFEGRIWDLIVTVPDHCLSFYFAYQSSCGCAVWWP